MTTTKQIEANKRNAARSTGPKSALGKLRSSANALKHGALANVPVIPGESADDWERHRSGILKSLAAEGELENTLAERVALCSWRLRRLAVYEMATTTAGITSVEEENRRAAEQVANPYTGFTHEPVQRDLIRLTKREDELVETREKLQKWKETEQAFEQFPELADDRTVTGRTAYGILHDVVKAAQEIGEGQIDEPHDDRLLGNLAIPEEHSRNPFRWDGWAVAFLRAASKPGFLLALGM